MMLFHAHLGMFGRACRTSFRCVLHRSCVSGRVGDGEFVLCDVLYGENIGTSRLRW